MSKRIETQEDDLAVSALPTPDTEPPAVDRNATVEPVGVAVAGRTRRMPLTVESVVSSTKRGLSDDEIGMLHGGKSRQAVHQFKKRHGLDNQGMEAVKRFSDRENKHLLLNALQKRVYDSIEDKDISKTSAYQRFISLGILQDKIRDLERVAVGSIVSIIAIAQRAEAAQQAAEVDVTPGEEVAE